MSIGSEKSPLNSSDSSCARAFLAITKEVSARWHIQHRLLRIHYTFKSLFNVHCLFGTGLKIRDPAFRLAECHGSLRGYHSLVLFYINLVSKDNLLRFRQNSQDWLEINLRTGNSRDLEGWPGSETRLSSCPRYQNSLNC